MLHLGLATSIFDLLTSKWHRFTFTVANLHTKSNKFVRLSVVGLFILIECFVFRKTKLSDRNLLSGPLYTRIFSRFTSPTVNIAMSRLYHSLEWYTRV